MTQYEKSESGEAKSAQEATAADLKLPQETTNVSEMQVQAQILSHLSNVRRDEFVKAVFEERFTRAEENLKRFQLTQSALSLMNQSIMRAMDLAEKAKQGDAAMMASLKEAAAKAAAEGTASEEIPTAKSPAEAEAQNEAAKLRIVKSEEAPAPEEGSGSSN